MTQLSLEKINLATKHLTADCKYYEKKMYRLSGFFTLKYKKYIR